MIRHKARLLLAGAAALFCGAALQPNAASTASPHRLPYPGGVSYITSQGNNGVSHKGISYYAFDFAMPVGSTIVATRGGKVTKVKENGSLCGCSSAYGSHGNYVVINHGDGTQGLYLHLQYNGAIVKVGDTVEAGQPIAKSGATGYTCGRSPGGCGPHLHFQVEKVGSSWWTQSVPLSFNDVATNKGVPLAGRTYKSGNYQASELPTATPTPATTPSPSPSPSPTTTPSPSPSPSPTASPTTTSTPTATPSATPEPSPSPTDPPTTTPSPSPTATPQPAPPGGGGGGGGGGSAPPPPPPTPTAPPPDAPVTMTLVASTGGTLTSVDGSAQVAFPAGAVDGSAVVTLQPVDLAPAPVAVSTEDGESAFLSGSTQTPAPPAGKRFGSAAVWLRAVDDEGQPIASFLQPGRVTLHYSSADLSGMGLTLEALQLQRWDGQAWTDVTALRDADGLTIQASAPGTGLYALTIPLPKPTVMSPPASTAGGTFTPALVWSNPPGTTQYHIQVLPHGNDGPGVDMIVGAPDLVQQARFAVPAPCLNPTNPGACPGGQAGNFILLPDMSYQWRVRTTSAAAALGVDAPQWSDWTAAAFRTPVPTSITISPLGLAGENRATSLTPTLQWANVNTNIFYYEVQVSQDPNFETDPERATAAVFWELVHGGAATPANSYTISAAHALQGGSRYFWRVRPRVQGDGRPVAWSDTWSFRTP